MKQIIKVTRAFALRHAGKSERRLFAVGIHQATQEDMDHWYMQSALKEGWAHVVAETPSEETAHEGEKEFAPAEDESLSAPAVEETSQPQQAKKAKK